MFLFYVNQILGIILFIVSVSLLVSSYNQKVESYNKFVDSILYGDDEDNAKAK